MKLNGGIFLVLQLILLLSGCKKNEKRPNVVFIFADQYRRASMGFLNEDPVVTPNIDKLAQEGVFFSKAVSNHPLCSPYRGMLMTGQYPLSNGVISNCHSGRNQYGNFIKKDAVCLSDVLTQNGYNAGFIGKWHLDGPKPELGSNINIWDSWTPFDHRHGFDFWYAYGCSNNHLNPHYWTTHAKEDEKHYIEQWSSEHEADIVIRYIENKGDSLRNSAKPFALIWAPNPPHAPYDLYPDKYKEHYNGKTIEDVLNRPNVRYKNDTTFKAGDPYVESNIHHAINYFAMVNGVDEQIGRVIEKLKQEGLYDNTIIIFSSDHGEMMGSHGLMQKNIWFKESYEIPFIVHWPQKIEPKTDDLLISVPDYMPTILGLVGLEDKIPESVEGNDYSGVLWGRDVERPSLQLYFGTTPDKKHLGLRGFRNHQYTFAVNKLSEREKIYFLYDDVNDPYQMNNIWGKDTITDNSMKFQLDSLLNSMDDPWIGHDRISQ
ncbi:sulfatase [Labilibacter sediminis]|nr:sulfatase [Labilibacter sediminis]